MDPYIVLAVLLLVSVLYLMASVCYMNVRVAGLSTWGFGVVVLVVVVFGIVYKVLRVNLGNGA